MQLLKETLTEEKNTMNCFKVILMFKNMRVCFVADSEIRRSVLL